MPGRRKPAPPRGKKKVEKRKDEGGERKKKVQHMDDEDMEFYEPVSW